MTVTLLAEQWHVARKPHGCNVCSGRIAPGDRYKRQRVVGYEPYTFKAHALCDAAYWLAHREGELLEDEEPEWFEVQQVVLRFFKWLTGALDDPSVYD